MSGINDPYDECLQRWHKKWHKKWHNYDATDSLYRVKIHVQDICIYKKLRLGAEIIFSRFISKGVGRKAAVCWRNSIKHNLTECMSVSMEYKTYFNLKWFPTKISKIIFVNPRQVKKQKLSCQFWNSIFNSLGHFVQLAPYIMCLLDITGLV